MTERTPTAVAPPERCLDAEHCITCSDEGVVMRVTEVVGGGLARCAVEGATAQAVEVQIDLVGAVVPGDSLLVHAGVALLRLAPYAGGAA